METENTHKSIREKVTAQIQSGVVTMHSPFHFALRSIALFASLLGATLVSTLILNFILFTIHFNNHHQLLGFGTNGWIAFLKFFPWPLLIIDLVFIGLVVHLVRSFRVGYKIPILYLALFLIAFIIVVSAILEESMSFNVRMSERTNGLLPPPILNVMENMRLPPRANRNVCHCEVLRIEESGTLFARDTRTGREVTLILRTPSVYATTTGLVPGDIIFIAGDYDGDTDEDDRIEVFGIKKLSGGRTPQSLDE